MSRFTDSVEFIALAMLPLLKRNGFGWLLQISTAFVFLKILIFNSTLRARSSPLHQPCPESLHSELLYFFVFIVSASFYASARSLVPHIMSKRQHSKSYCVKHWCALLN